MRPFSYYGSKSNLFKWILSYFPKNYVDLHYIEPFFGAGTLFFNKKPSKLETINDIDPAISTFYKVLKNTPNELIKKIDEILITEKAFKAYQPILANKKKSDDMETAIAVFICYNMSFSSHFRGAFSKMSKVNIFKKNIKTNNPKYLFLKKLQSLYLLSRRLSLTNLLNRDAINIIKYNNNENTFFYLDPPYPGAVQSAYKCQFSEKDFKNLLDCLKVTKAKFLLSCYKREWMNIPKRWNTIYKKSSLSKNIKIIKHKERVECLIKNY